MSESESTTASAAGTEVHCSTCEAAVALFEHPTKGLRLVCACDHIAVSIDEVAAESSLFTPLTGRWSTIDESPGVKSDTRGGDHG